VTSPRPGVPGATRSCPHCRETILESAAVCPACRHHLRFASSAPAASAGAVAALTPLRVEGQFSNPAEGGNWEYSMVLTIRNERGEEVARRVVGVGAIQPQEQRTFTLSVEMLPANDRGGKRRH
jgi:hypothetical protein